MDLLGPDLKKKHEKMAETKFAFLRATYYRWVERFPHVCPDAITPKCVCLGDAHIENFGVWRDAEARLVWGANDFDEMDRLPPASDLVRLATSIRLANDDSRLAISPADSCDALIEGYRDGGRPYVLAEDHGWLREEAFRVAKPGYFDDLQDSLKPTDAVPDALRQAMPEDATQVKFGARSSGLGSLGRPRFVAIGLWRGGYVARETKRWAPPASNPDAGYRDFTNHLIRSPDPSYRMIDGWQIRRLAPDSIKIELAAFDSGREERKLIEAMGRELANLHTPTRDRAPGFRAAQIEAWSAAMADEIEADFRAWRDRAE